MSNVKIKNALLSVSNKENLLDVVKVLNKYKIGIISSEGTHKYLKKKVTRVLKFQNILVLKKC